MAVDSKPYWMKFYGRFFDKHEIKILLDEDRDYVFFYIALLLESVAHKGMLRYNEKRAYCAHMLSHLFNMPEDKVQESIEKLKEYDLLEVLEDGTIYLPAAPAMCGCGSESAERMRKYREKAKISENNEGDVQLVRTCDAQVRTSASHVIKCDGNIEYRVKSIENRDIDGGGTKGGTGGKNTQPNTTTSAAATFPKDLVTDENIDQVVYRLNNAGGKHITPEEVAGFKSYVFLRNANPNAEYKTFVTKQNFTKTLNAWLDIERKKRAKEMEHQEQSADDVSRFNRRMEEGRKAELMEMEAMLKDEAAKGENK